VNEARDPRRRRAAPRGARSAQRDFAAARKVLFPPGGDRGANQHGRRQADTSVHLPESDPAGTNQYGRGQDDSTVVLTKPDTAMAEWCLGYGFHERRRVAG
jgi:hypothetical protein